MNETIINGIDVSECEFYEEKRELPDNLNGGYYIQHNYCSLQGDNYCICNKNPNCYFKQLKRLQEENEELKKQLEFSRTHKTVLDAERIKYKQALEEIREIAKGATNSKDCYIYMYAGRMYCEPILKKINEALND